MKKMILYIFPIVAVLGIVILVKISNQSAMDIVNYEKVALEFKENEVQCPQCNMFLVHKEHTAQAITSDNKTYFFDDPGCLVLWIDQKHKKKANEIVKWVYAHDSKKWIDAQKAFYSFSDKTPMNYGFTAYENEIENYIGYDEMRLRMLRGENMTNPKIRKKLLGN